VGDVRTVRTVDALSGKIAVVTGAGSGIGRGIVRALAAEGTSVVVADIEEDAAAAVADELRTAGAEAIAVGCDVSDRAQVESLADAAWEHFGHVDLMVNNAGVIGRTRRCIDADERDARWMFDVNVFGTWYGCSVFGKRFVEQGTPAHILNTASENSFGVPHTGAAFYTASKHAVLGLSDVLRQELPDFIGVSVLCPGAVATKLTSAIRNRPERYGGAFDGTTTMPFGMDPDEVGRKAVDGIRAGAFYIVTHPPVRELVEERTAEVLAAFDAQAPRFDGDEALDTRKLLQRMRDEAAATPRPTA
jgi:NAD(P)-dependent dehydrogenase (short-subunit alcohol dehydrogenase family)